MSAQVVVVAEEIGKQESILGLKDVESDEVQSVSERTVLVLELPSRDFLRLLLLLINSSGISGILLSILLLTQDWMFLLSVTVLRYASPTEVCLVFTGLQIVSVLCVELPMLGVMFCWWFSSPIILTLSARELSVLARELSVLKSDLSLSLLNVLTLLPAALRSNKLADS